MAFKDFLATLISDSKTPLKGEPSGGFQFHFIPLLALSSTIFSWWIDWISSLSSLSAATKLLLLSLVTSYGLPLMATIQLNAFRKSVVLNEKATSKCTALVVEHVNRHKYLLADTLCVILVVKGPAWSTQSELPVLHASSHTACILYPILHFLPTLYDPVTTSYLC